MAHISNTPMPLKHAPKTHANPRDYRVKKGDSLSRIAHQHHLTLKQLIHLNPGIQRKRFLKLGMPIRVRYD
jgi:LysM repeat protein